MKLISVAVVAVPTAAPLSDEAQMCLDAEECVIVRKQDLQDFLNQIKQQADSRIWCKNA